LALDLLFFSPPYTISALPACGLSGFIAVLYYFWVEQCYAQNGFYPYPIFDKVGYEGRIVLFAGSAATMALSIGCFKWLYSAVNGRAMDVKYKPVEKQT